MSAGKCRQYDQWDQRKEGNLSSCSDLRDDGGLKVELERVCVFVNGSQRVCLSMWWDSVELKWAFEARDQTRFSLNNHPQGQRRTAGVTLAARRESIISRLTTKHTHTHSPSAL